MKKYRIIKITIGTGEYRFYIQERKTVFFFFTKWENCSEEWTFYHDAVAGFNRYVKIADGIHDIDIARGVLKYMESEEDKRRLSNLVIKKEVVK